MKNFILGCLFVLLTSATLSQTDLLTVKPAIPKSTIILEGTWGTTRETKNRMNNYIKQGYIFKSSVSIDTRALIIMEKY